MYWQRLWLMRIIDELKAIDLANTVTIFMQEM